MNYYSSPRWTNEIADCSMPMTFDTYSNCAFNCLYCFSMFQRAIGKPKNDYLTKQVKYVNINKIKDIFLGKRESQFSAYIKDRKVFQWGGLSDQFDGYEKNYGITLELLKFFKDIDYPICFSTKSVWWLKDKRYTDLFKGQDNWNCKFSIITLDKEKAKLIERGCPSPQDRIEAIKIYSDLNNGGATLRLRPFIIGISTPSYLDLIELCSKAGATALSAEFFCMEQRSALLMTYMPLFNKLCGFDLFAFYKKYSVSSGYMRLNRNVKRPFIINMQNKCKELNMRFYVSDAHFKELCNNGSCCGLNSSWNYSKGQWCEALQIAKINGSVKYNDVSCEINKYFKFDWNRAEGFNGGSTNKRVKFYGMSMADYMRWLWNHPESGQSPYKLFEGILIPDGSDSDNNIIYKYNTNLNSNIEIKQV